jgi:hypothetical protein
VFENASSYRDCGWPKYLDLTAICRDAIFKALMQQPSLATVTASGIINQSSNPQNFHESE